MPLHICIDLKVLFAFALILVIESTIQKQILVMDETALTNANSFIIISIDLNDDIQKLQRVLMYSYNELIMLFKFLSH